MNTIAHHAFQRRPVGIAVPGRRLLRDFLALLKEWRRRMRSRQELAALCDRCLRDMGATRYDVYREIRKPFWRG